jgi:hypothetical protein
MKCVVDENDDNSLKFDALHRLSSRSRDTHGKKREVEKKKKKKKKGKNTYKNHKHLILFRFFFCYYLISGWKLDNNFCLFFLVLVRAIVRHMNSPNHCVLLNCFEFMYKIYIYIYIYISLRSLSINLNLTFLF